MNFSFEKKDFKKLFIWYSISFAIVAFFVYGSYYFSGHSLIWQIDGSQQHLPLLINYRKALIEFLHHPFSGITTWSWKYGLGADTFQIYSYYTVGDIFAYLTLLFPASKIIFAYQLMIILRLYFAGLAFTYFANHFDLKKSVIIPGAMVYIFNAYLLYANVAQPFFTTAFIIFPLIILGLEKVLQEKSAWMLTFAFTWMLINNFYFAFILGIGAMIYLVIRVFFTYRKTLNYFLIFRKLAGSTILSLLLSSVLLIPELLAVQNSTRAGSTFANGLKFYPLYYYLALPSQLINGGNRDFYFWSALGFSSIAFFGVIYVLAKYRKYPVMTAIFILSGIMLSFPAFGAAFNGLMSPSNRWTLMLCLPVSLSVCILLEHVKELSPKMLKYITITTAIYISIIGINYYFQNSEKLFIPIIFLFVFLGLIFWLRFIDYKHAYRWANILVLLNVILNAIYFETPYNGGFANEMLPAGAYDKLQNQRYAGLDSDIDNDNTFKVSTISNNYYLGENFKMYNTLNEKLHGLSSYYSLQNKYIGQFALNMQNVQYETNVPLQQFDDRSVILNFLGVKYLFTQLNQENDTKIPYGYHLDKTTRLIYDVNQNSSKNQQTRRYATKNNFPLLYWEDTAITPKNYDKLSVSQKERLLSKAVFTSSNNAKGLKKAKISNTDVIDIPYVLVSSRGNVIDTNNLEKLDANETYKLVLQLDKLKEKNNLPQNVELHVEINDIKYTPFSFKKQIALEEKNQTDDLTNGLLAANEKLTYYKYFRYHVMKGSPDMSYALNISSNLGTETITQPRQSKTSFFKIVNSGTMNMGYFKNLPETLKLTPSKMGTYSFKLKVYAEPLNTSYDKEVAKIQKHALQNLKFNKHGLEGKITTNRIGILTSSIPYSTGWTATVDGKKAPVIRTNQAFVGLKLPQGTHKVKLVYNIPGLKLGMITSIVGLILLAISLIYTKFKKK